MEFGQLLSQYRLMNVAHLTVDELQHELRIRQIPQSDPRTKLEKVLSSHLKEERYKSNVSYVRICESVQEELDVCGDKMFSIKLHLESARQKKVPGQLYKTRLIHILFRMERLKRQITDDDDLQTLANIAVECVRLINTYFSITSHIAEVRQSEMALINKSIDQARRMEANNGVSEEERESENENDENEDEDEFLNENFEENVNDELNENENNVLPGTTTGQTTDLVANKEGNDKGSKSASARDVEKEQLVAQNMELMDLVKGLLQRIEILESKQPATQPQIDPCKTTNSTRIEEPKSQQNPEKQTQSNPNDFLGWLKGKCSSLENSTHAEQKDTDPKSTAEQSSHTAKPWTRRLPVHKWTIRYDGMDNGRKLNEFLKEVEFNARSEGYSESELFLSAHYLFTSKARSWFMEVNGNNELGSWQRLVQELKNEFLPVDIDYMYERQACNRKQGARETFQDFYLDMVRIFRNMTQPWDEKRKFDVLFRNTREDCKIAMLAAGTKDVHGMREFGKKFDAINWQLYKKKETKFSGRSTPVDEVRQQQKPFNGNGSRVQGRSSDKRGLYQQRESETKTNQKGPWKPRSQDTGQQKTEQDKPKSKQESSQRQTQPTAGSSGSNPLQRIVKAYIPVRRGVCFNCHEDGHSFSDCSKTMNVFCYRCGFPGFDAKSCPYCESKNSQKTAQ